MTDRLKTFIWADGARPTRATIKDHVAFYLAMGLTDIFILLNDTDEHDQHGDGCDWDFDLLVEFCQALREAGLRVHWMWWMRSTTKAVNQLLKDSLALYRRFVPDGVQFDVEEDWKKLPDNKHLALLARLVEGIKSIHRHLAIALHKVLYSVSAITLLFKRKFTAEDEAWLMQDIIRAFFGQSYLFWKPVADHWSHTLPRAEGRLQDLVYGAIDPYVERGQIEEVYCGQSAYMQNIPGVRGLDGMRWAVAWTQAKAAANRAYKGLGWWSRKHIIGKGAAAKRAIIREAAGLDPSALTLSDTGQPPVDLSKAMAYNARAASGLGWAGTLPAMALERYSGLAQPPGSEAFARAVLDFQAEEGLTRDGKLGKGTLGVLHERFPAAILMGPPEPDRGTWPWAQIQVEQGQVVARPGARLSPADTAANDWQILV